MEGREGEEREAEEVTGGEREEMREKKGPKIRVVWEEGGERRREQEEN
jgi:hypothetical protein